MTDPRFNDTLEYLYRLLPMFQRDGSQAFKKDLTNTRELCWVLGLPQWQFKSIHIAGTNGKGSVSSMLSSILQEAGYKVGLYTSPHLQSFTERIRINGRPIPQEEVVEFVEQMQPFIERIRPSFFELTVAMAFQYFSDQEVDIAVIETGMGGRLDSTNVLRPEICAITNISFDHQAFLGNTLEAIAGEKAGIIKPYTPVIVGKKHPSTDRVFSEIAAAHEAPLIFAEDRYSASILSFDLQTQEVQVTNKEDEEQYCFTTDLTGSYQLENIQTTLAIVDALTEDGWAIDQEHLARGLSRVRQQSGLRGRMECLSENPLMLCDVGHNVAGVRHILHQLSQFSSSRLHFVWGMVSDKGHKEILELLPSDATYYWVRPSVQRALDHESLQAKAKAVQLRGEAFSSVREGLEAARQAAEPQDLIMIGGSTFVVADALACFPEETPRKMEIKTG